MLLYCEPTIDKPRVILDNVKNEFLFEGLSMCEDAYSFYQQVIASIKKYAKSPNPKTVVKFRLSYFNTASSKMILEVMLNFDEIFHKGHDVTIEWHYRHDDEEMQEAGEIYASRLELPFKFIKDDTMD